MDNTKEVKLTVTLSGIIHHYATTNVDITIDADLAEDKDAVLEAAIEATSINTEWDYEDHDCYFNPTTGEMRYEYPQPTEIEVDEIENSDD